MTSYVVVDSETTGLEPQDANLLELCMWSTALDLERPLATLELQIKHKIYKVTPQAMIVNKKNLAEHHDKAVSVREAREDVQNFLEDSCPGRPGTPLGRLTILGHCIHFDIAFLKDLIGSEIYGHYISHRVVDTHSIAHFLQTVGTIPADVSLSLQGLTKHFDIPHDTAHTAVGDVQATWSLFRRMVAACK